jgi:acyl-CoA reductase-like NAD-dependent aldehyde dehydrogenase
MKECDDSNGYFVSPGIHHIKSFDASSSYQGNVLFCPDIALYEYDKLEEAIENINNTDASFSVSFIGDANIVEQRRSLFRALNIQINLPTVEIDSSLPLPGRFSTGLHRFHGPAMALYLCVPQVTQKREDMAPFMKNWPMPNT